jgi:3-hydroxyisobutyrate dehydrogenase
MAENVRIGWIGTGVMGENMCRRLMEKCETVFVYNRTRSKAQSLLDHGATWCATPSEVAKNADLLFTMVGYPSDVERVYLGEDGVVSALPSGSVAVDLTTTKPSLAVAISAALKARDCSFIDAPVSGGDVGAKNGTLSIMVGGPTEAVARVMPYFELMGKNIVHQGDAGQGQHTKMCNQVIIASTMVGACESLLYAYRAGLDPNLVLQSISSGAAGCWTLDNLVPRMIKRNFEPGFYVEHFIKDMEIALEEAGRMDLALPGLALAHQLYRALKAQGGGRKGTQALLLALETLSPKTA